MVTWSEFILDGVQVAAFVAEPSTFSTGKAAAAVLSRFGERLNGDMKSLPAGKAADFIPAEVPRVTFQSDDGDSEQAREPTWKVNLGPARIDCVWNNVSLSAAEQLDARVAECADVLGHYVRTVGVSISRVSLIVTRICRRESPAQELISKFCSDQSQREPLNRSASFEIHNHKVYTPAGLGIQVNSWMRCKSAFIKADDRPAILVEQDWNSLSDESQSRRFDAATLGRFFEIGSQESTSILRKYFPE